jgi:DNA-directed RNA polymerase specialized sigma24 family protein
MLESKNELATDLEWMLQSGNVSEDLLLETLIEEFYLPVYHLTLAIIDDQYRFSGDRHTKSPQETAQRATTLTLANVLAEQYTYRDNIGLRAWVFAFAVDACFAMLDGSQLQQSEHAEAGTNLSEPDLPMSWLENKNDSAIWPVVDQLNRQSRTVVILTYLAGCDSHEISKILKISPSEVATQLETVYSTVGKRIKKQVEQDGTNDPDDHDKDPLDEIIRKSLSRRWPVPVLSQKLIKKQSNKISKLAGRSRTRKWRINKIFEFAAVSAIILAITLMIWATNTFWPENEVAANIPPTKLVTKIVYVTRIVERYIKPAKTPTPTQLPQFDYYLVSPGETIDSVALHLGTTVEALLDLNRLPPDAVLVEGQKLLVPGQFGTIPPAATEVPVRRRISPLQAPYTSMEILKRLEVGEDLFNTLWFDAVIIDHGPDAYIGPARMRRVQAWLSMDQILLVVGRYDDQIEAVWLMLGDEIYTAFPSRNQSQFVLSTSQYQSGGLGLPQGLEQLLLTVLDDNSWRYRAIEGHRMIPVERSKWAGRPVLIAEEFTKTDNQRQARLWIDDRTGLVLRKQWYSKAYQMKLQEISLLDIAYDVDFPQELFAPLLPWRGGFAVDHSGKQANLDTDQILSHPGTRVFNQRDEAPEGYDSSKDELIFKYPKDFLEYEKYTTIDLNTVAYHLGKVDFGNPWRMICQRSPNGARIAYVSQPPTSNLYLPSPDWPGSYSDLEEARLRIFQLPNLPQTPLLNRDPLPNLKVTAFAWAPDSRHLAVFGFLPSAETGSLYILDSDTGQAEKIMQLNNAVSLIWNPDGTKIAMLASYYSEFTDEKRIVIDVEKGSIINFIPIDIRGAYTDEWLVNKWQTEFPIRMGGLQSCATVPDIDKE